MSMVGLALRLAAVRALQHDATIAEDRVFDSAILPIDKMVSEQPQPFVVVSTEGSTERPTGRDINNGSNEILFVIEVAMARVVALPAKDGNGVDYMIDVYESDANLELGIAILKRQIFAVLFGRGGGIWGDVFRAFANTIADIETLRGSNFKDGVRFAGRQIGFTLRAIAEPAFGPIQAGTPWEKFIAALEADPSLTDIGRIIRSAIEVKPIGWPETYTAAAVLAGYTEEEAQKIGIALPFPAAPDGVTAPVTAATLMPEGWVADAATVEDQWPETPA